VWAQAELKKVVGLIGARVLPVNLAVPKANSLFDANGGLIDDELRVNLSEVVRDLVEAARERETIQATG
jgi:chromate reductase